METPTPAVRHRTRPSSPTGSWSRSSRATGSTSSTGAGRATADGPGVLLDPRPRADGLDLGAGRAPALRAAAPVVAMDLRGHGLSDAPTETAPTTSPILAEDVVAVAEGSGPARRRRADRVVLVGHGFGAIVAVEAAGRSARGAPGVVLVDGGWEALEAATGLDVDEFLRGLDEPPEVMRSMTRVPRRPARRSIPRRGTPTRSARRARRSSRRTPGGSCRRRGRTRSRPASGRCSRTTRSRRSRPSTRRSSRSSPRPTTSTGARERALAAVDAARAGGRPRADPHRAVPPRRPQPDALPSGRGQRGDPVGRRATPGDQRRSECGSSTRRATSPTTSPPRRSWARRSRPTRSPSGPRRIRTHARGGRRLRRSSRRPSTARRRSRRSTTRASSRFLEVAWSEVRRQQHRRSRSCRPTRTRTASMFEGMSPEAVARARARARARRRAGRVLGARLGRAARRRARTSPRAARWTSR